MTIVDQQHASQIVTKKGRNYKYDAIECMVQSLPDWQSNEINTYLISDYNSPGKMINALEAKYLISESIPSPMGAFLSGFDTESQRDTFVKLETDRRLSWTEMKVDIQK
jgi:copper chaperone NosL